MQTNGAHSPRPQGDMRASFAQTWEGFLPAGAIVMAKKQPHANPHAQPEASAHHHATEVPFFFFTGEISESESVLFQKIIQALGLAPTQYLSGTELPANVLPTVCVRFGGTVGEWSEIEILGAHTPLFSTHALSDLDRDAGLKKETWNHLKQVCERIGFALQKK